MIEEPHPGRLMAKIRGAPRHAIPAIDPGPVQPPADLTNTPYTHAQGA